MVIVCDIFDAFPLVVLYSLLVTILDAYIELKLELLFVKRENHYLNTLKQSFS